MYDIARAGRNHSTLSIYLNVSNKNYFVKESFYPRAQSQIVGKQEWWELGFLLLSFIYTMFNAAAAICSGEGSKPLTQMKHGAVSLIGKAAVCSESNIIPVMTETKIKGLSTELQCQLYFTSLGYNVSIPLGEDCKYDMIVDVDGQLLRVQVKTSTIAQTGITFSTKSVYMTADGPKQVQYNQQDVDFFATCYNGLCYLIPISECLGKERTLKFTLDRKNDAPIYLLNDFKADDIIQRVKTHTQMPTGRKMKVNQYDIDSHILLNSYPSLQAAADAVGKPTGSSHISQCAHGSRQTAYGYIWDITEEM